jgi:hypothetical protein
MPEYLMKVSRTVTLAIEAGCHADAEEAAFTQAWSWQPESAAGGDQGSVSVRTASSAPQWPTGRVPGHGLRAEGRPCEPDGYGRGGYVLRRGFLGRALCECGERSPDLDSNAARKRWHVQHKEEVRSRG